MSGNRRTFVLLSLVGLLAGCSTCQTPYDYCSAVQGPDGCVNCDFGARRSSMFAPQEGTPPSTPVAPTPAKAADDNDVEPGIVQQDREEREDINSPPEATELARTISESLESESSIER